jgi:hypothetical protein
MNLKKDLKPFTPLAHFRQNTQLIVVVPFESSNTSSCTKAIADYSYSQEKQEDSPLEKLKNSSNSNLISIWVQYLDQEPIILSLPSYSVIFHIKKAFIESLNSPLASFSPGMVHVFKNQTSQKSLEANVSITALLKDNHYSYPLIFRNSADLSNSGIISSNSQILDTSISKIHATQNLHTLSKIPTPSNVLISPSISSYNPPNTLHYSYNNNTLMEEKFPIPTALKIDWVSQIEEGEIEESTSKVVKEVSKSIVQIPVRKLGQTPTPSSTATQSPKYTTMENPTQAPHVAREIITKLNHVAEPKKIEVTSTVVKAPLNNTNTLQQTALSSTVKLSASSTSSFSKANVSINSPSVSSPFISSESTDKLGKKPFVNIRTVNTAVPIPRRPLVNKKPQTSSTPVPTMNSKWPIIQRGHASAPSAKTGITNYAASPVTPRINPIPSSVKILKRPLVKSVSTAGLGGTAIPSPAATSTQSVTNVVTERNQVTEIGADKNYVTPITMKFKPPASIVSKMVLTPNNATASAPSAPSSTTRNVPFKKVEKEASPLSVPKVSLQPVEKPVVVSAENTPIVTSTVLKSEKKRSASSISSSEALSSQKKMMKRTLLAKYNTPLEEGFKSPKKFEFHYQSFLKSGTMKEKYKVTAQNEGTKGVIRLESSFQSITAMPVYMDQSIEVIQHVFSLILARNFDGKIM